MGFFKQFIETLVENLNSYFDKSNMTVVKEFSPDLREYPLKNPLISLGYNLIEKNDKTPQFSGYDRQGENYSQTINMVINADIYVPAKNCDIDCSEILWQVMEYLTFVNTPYKVKKIKAEQVLYYSKLHAFKMPCTVNIESVAKHSEQNDKALSMFKVVRRN